MVLGHCNITDMHLSILDIHKNTHTKTRFFPMGKKQRFCASMFCSAGSCV